MPAQRQISEYLKVGAIKLPLKYLILIYLSLSSYASFANEVEYAWLDELHEGVSGSLHESVEWIDSYWADEEYSEKSRINAKIRLGWEPRERELDDYLSRIRLKVKLPKLARRVDLVFSDYDDIDQENLSDELIQEKSTQRQSHDDFNLALRWVHKSAKKEKISSKIGLASEPDVYTKIAYRRIFESSEHSNIMLQPSLYYYFDQGIGARLSANYQYNSSKQSLFEQNNSWRYLKGKDDGEVKWQHSLLHYYQYSDKVAFISGIFANGITQDSYRVKNRGVFFRYRKRSVRDWLYFEVEPFIHWPQEFNYQQTYGIALRLEGNFSR